MCGEGAPGLVVIVRWIAVEGGRGEDYEVSSTEGHATRFVV